jgi:hypothetical protein
VRSDVTHAGLAWPLVTFGHFQIGHPSAQTDFSFWTHLAHACLGLLFLCIRYFMTKEPTMVCWSANLFVWAIVFSAYSIEIKIKMSIT